MLQIIFTITFNFKSSLQVAASIKTLLPYKVSTVLKIFECE